MPFTTEQQQKIKQVLAEKIKRPCPACGEDKFSLGTDFINLLLQGSPSQGLVLGGPPYLRVAVMCSICGHTQLHNVIILGLADLLGVELNKAPAAMEEQPHAK